MNTPQEPESEDFVPEDAEDFDSDDWETELDEESDFDELDEIDDFPTADEIEDWSEDEPDVEQKVRFTGKVDSRHRVQLYVQKLLSEFPDCDNLEEILEEILTESPHHQTRDALRRLLERGCSSSELRVAHLLRQAWTDEPTYGSAGYLHGDAPLGWPEAAEISKIFRDDPDADEVALFLVEAFERYSNDCQPGDRPEFGTYLIWMADSEDPDSVVAPGVSINDTLRNWGDRD